MPFDDSTRQANADALFRMDRVIALLSRDGSWCKGALRSQDGAMCILGAMEAADARIALKEPILMAIRQVTRRDYQSIIAFNDNHLTMHWEVIKVLRRARKNIAAGIVP